MFIWQCGLCSRRFSEPTIPAGCTHCAPRYHVSCLCGSKWYCTMCMSSDTKDLWTCIRCDTPSCGQGNPCFGERKCGECGEEDDICKDCTAKEDPQGLGDDVTAIMYHCPLCKNGICNNCSRSSFNPCDECGMIFDACSKCMQTCASFGCDTPVCGNCSRDSLRNPASRFCDDCVLKYARW
ncbi:hypothetical protein CONPUDRAFT_162088 [Coniophora puteana RWD-64-598 SS2]|uniref:Uncharacterized protein n=1 Tax=Coniophora puteana (strain RWD-64-598) TaxID=741705 RepID=A0A5M3N017_CONPW|nr:uncharacterized protein CONPUDRAFT_162088 [Coniophora puteana RWD-64-598 SS2]EIW84740.1 hypothetical protein CONPUDRAFT_162088 [Coniophora puteana RWD-64-598 SS2]